MTMISSVSWTKWDLTGSNSAETVFLQLNINKKIKRFGRNDVVNGELNIGYV
jgi:hypothetical protein